MVPKRCASTRAFRKQPQVLLVVEMAWSTGAATPNYHPVAHGASRTLYSKGYRAITCRYIQMKEQLRLLYQLRGNCSHSTERLALYKAQSSRQKGGFKCDLPASSNQLPRLLRSVWGSLWRLWEGLKQGTDRLKTAGTFLEFLVSSAPLL